MTISAPQMLLLDAQLEVRFASALAAELVRFFPFRFGANKIVVPVDHALACIRHGKSLELRIPSYYTALNRNTNQIDYVIGQTDLPNFMSNEFAYGVQAWADHQPPYGRDAGNSLIKISTGVVEGDTSAIGDGFGLLESSWGKAATSPEYLLGKF
jgi:hypothetical protein